MSSDACAHIGKAHPKCKFTKEEDAKLASIVSSMKELNWKIVSEKMGDRNPRQCKERWENYLDPNVNRSPFTTQEDILLIEKFQELGPKWVVISKFFNNRSDICIKSRYMVLKRRGVTLEFLRTHDINYLALNSGKKRISPIVQSRQESPVYVQTPPQLPYYAPQEVPTIPEQSMFNTTHTNIQTIEQVQSAAIDDVYDWNSPDDFFQTFELAF